MYNENKKMVAFFHEIERSEQLLVIEETGILPLKKDEVVFEFSEKGELLNINVVRDGELII